MGVLLGDAPPPLAAKAARPQALADIERSVAYLAPCAGGHSSFAAVYYLGGRST